MIDEHIKTESVKTTAHYLDIDMPGWAQKLVEKYGTGLQDLLVSDPDACVTAGLYGDYDEGVTRLINVGNSVDNDRNKVSDSVNGATANMYFDDDTMRALWLAEVSARLG